MGIVPRVISAICARRSAREGFTGQTVAAEVIDDIVRCGLSAPSSKNAQPWRIHVVSNRSILASLADSVQHAKDADCYVPIDPLTGRRRQEWQSTVAESAEVLRRVALALFVENRGAFSRGRRSVALADAGSRESAVLGYSLEMIGLGASIENMWLAAHAHGLSGVFMGDVLIAEDVIRATLEMEGDLTGVLALGYSTAGAPFEKRLADGLVVHHL